MRFARDESFKLTWYHSFWYDNHTHSLGIVLHRIMPSLDNGEKTRFNLFVGFLQNNHDFQLTAQG